MRVEVGEQVILEFKALVMSKGVFNQLQIASSPPDRFDQIIGLVNSDMGEYAVVRTFEGVGGLKRIRWTELHRLANARVMRSTGDPNPTWKSVIDELHGGMKEAVPQIFLK